MRNLNINLKSYSQSNSFDLLEVTQRKKFINGEVSNEYDTVYKVLINYEPIEIKVNDDGAITREAETVAAYKQSGTPLKATFENCQIIISPKNQYELMIRGTAEKAIVAKPKQA